MEPTTILIAAKGTPEEIAKKQQEKKDKEQRKKERKAEDNKNDTYCGNVFNDIRAILDGKGKVNNIDDYKYIEDGVTKYLVGNEPGYDKGYVKSSMASRVKDLKVDIYDLANKHREQKYAHPEHGSYEGHQHTLDNQRKALVKALIKFDRSCKEYPLSEKQQEVKKRVEQAVKTPTPQKPDREFRQNSATANESQKLKQVINSIPGMSQEQKDATRKALESTGVPKIIKNSINGGKEYWETTGKPQLKAALDTLVKAGKIAAVIAVVILEFVGKLATGQLVSNPQDTTETPSIASTDKTVFSNENSSNAQNINPATPVATTSTNTLESKQPISSAPFTSTIPTNQIDSNSKSLVPVSETNSAAQNTNQAPVTTAKNLTTQESSQTNLQATSSMGETKEVAQANNAKLQEILARMQTRDRSQTSNNIAATTAETNQNQGSITTTPNTATASNGKDAAFIINTSQNSVTPSSTALTGTIAEGTSQIARTSTALTGTAAGSSPTALTGTIARGESSKQTQLQQGMAPS